MFSKRNSTERMFERAITSRFDPFPRGPRWPMPSHIWSPSAPRSDDQNASSRECLCLFSISLHRPHKTRCRSECRSVIKKSDSQGFPIYQLPRLEVSLWWAIRRLTVVVLPPLNVPLCAPKCGVSLPDAMVTVQWYLHMQHIAVLCEWESKQTITSNHAAGMEKDEPHFANNYLLLLVVTGSTWNQFWRGCQERALGWFKTLNGVG